jgi:hypothetical protein
VSTPWQHEAEPAGKEIATAWLTQLKRVTTGNDVVALAYGNPDISLAKRLAPSELKNLLCVWTGSFAVSTWSELFVASPRFSGALENLV